MANDEETAVEDEYSREAVWIIIRAEENALIWKEL